MRTAKRPPRQAIHDVGPPQRPVKVQGSHAPVGRPAGKVLPVRQSGRHDVRAASNTGSSTHKGRPSQCRVQSTAPQVGHSPGATGQVQPKARHIDGPARTLPRPGIEHPQQAELEGGVPLAHPRVDQLIDPHARQGHDDTSRFRTRRSARWSHRVDEDQGPRSLSSRQALAVTLTDATPENAWLAGEGYAPAPRRPRS